MADSLAAPLPALLTLAAHPLRWQLLVALAGSDLRVGELTELVDEPQNLVSYHLTVLRRGGLVSAHQSSFDGRAAYYRVHLDRFAAMLSATGAALHPSLADERGAAAHSVARGSVRARVLFLCTGNGTRSQMAEALLRASTNGRYTVASAGSHPKPVHPNAVRVLAERGIDISGAQSKSLDQFLGRRFDHVVTLCDRVREVCPDFPGAPRLTHWSIEDPSRVPGSARATMPAFRAVAADLQLRIDQFVASIDRHHRSIKKETRNGR